jgi:hypothetical protein
MVDAAWTVRETTKYVQLLIVQFIFQNQFTIEIAAQNVPKLPFLK